MKAHYPIHRSAENEGFIATFPDLPGCSAWGATETEALNESHAAAAAWLKACKAAGNPIPEPSPLTDETDYSGRFVMRIPRLHADLVKIGEAARREPESVCSLPVGCPRGREQRGDSMSGDAWRFAPNLNDP